jgi:hypothetical protein
MGSFPIETKEYVLLACRKFFNIQEPPEQAPSDWHALYLDFSGRDWNR